MKTRKTIKTPIIKFNGGNPVAICHSCRTMMCYVSYNNEDGKWKIREMINEKTTVNFGDDIPLYCDKHLKKNL